MEDTIKRESMLTDFYGYPKGGRRRDSWNMLRELRDMSQRVEGHVSYALVYHKKF